ncbi:ABC transporter ATP-binding protein [Candidatus Kryptobacter tengchongensis]|uniref:ABC transporter ATP-binding protein n=1 Tax=Kryptobacter tengchongensis TaxID=1643429 RepID=UPI0007074103|nr:ABC transporter ATP-binding protein [Candidatus Kryptobacter tengchongensis]CUS77794.1 oligopeptide transport system ATP-binding protein [Candidatus Kryptobacter tengchongensis]
MILSVKNLATYFFLEDKIIKAVDGISFEINEGEIVALIGESGSGKSVTALSIVRLIDPPGRIVSGEILWRGEIDILKLDEGDLKNIRGKEIGIIFQDVTNSLNPVLTVGRQVREVFENQFGVDKKSAKVKVLELFERIGISEPEKVYELYPHQLSGGLKQRILIAMAFASKPKLIIADEPTSLVDALTQIQILDLIKSFQIENKTSILLITHNFGIISEIANRVYVMHRGKIIESGETFEVLSSPKHPYTRNLINSAKFLSF